MIIDEFIDAKNDRDVWRKMSVVAEIEEVIIGTRHEDGEHQHINFTLKGITHLGRKIQKLDVRLVEHKGNPGIVIFDSDHQERAFYDWRMSGEENSRKFMLIIPSEQKGQEWLVQATSNDLLLITNIIKYLGKEFLKVPTSGKRFWDHACNSLLNNISSIPKRLHYDSIQLIESEERIKTIRINNPTINASPIIWDKLTIKNNKIKQILSTGEVKKNLVESKEKGEVEIRRIIFNETRNFIQLLKNEKN